MEEQPLFNFNGELLKIIRIFFLVCGGIRMIKETVLIIGCFIDREEMNDCRKNGDDKDGHKQYL